LHAKGSLAAQSYYATSFILAMFLISSEIGFSHFKQFGQKKLL
jgi:hypothetical protein